MAVFFEGRRAQNSEDNIELGDGGDMTSMVRYFMGWLFFLKNPVCTAQFVPWKDPKAVTFLDFVWSKMKI